MKITRFGKIFELNIVAVYKKGKKGNLSSDNIRIVIDNYKELFNNSYDPLNCGMILCMPSPPKFDKTNPIYKGVCGFTGCKMSSRPELIGDLNIVSLNVDPTLEHLKIGNYNYYKVDMNSCEVPGVFDDIINKIECFSV